MCNLITSQPRADIKFLPNGRIDITAKVTGILSLCPGDAINIWEEDGEYYLYVARRNADKKFFARCQENRKGSKYVRVWCKQLSQAVIEISGNKEAHLMVGEPVNLNNLGIAIPLITRNNLYRP